MQHYCSSGCQQNVADQPDLLSVLHIVPKFLMKLHACADFCLEGKASRFNLLYT